MSRVVIRLASAVNAVTEGQFTVHPTNWFPETFISVVAFGIIDDQLDIVLTLPT